MLRLIKLEMKKLKLKDYIGYSIIVHLVLIALLSMLQIIFKIENEPIGEEALNVSIMVINIMGRLTFTVFASTLICKLIISEYNNKTINLLFMYPMSRKKILLSKLIIIFTFTFINIIISYILLTLTIITLNTTLDLFTWTLTMNNIINNMPMVILNSLLTSGIALIPLYFGMKKKSVPTTISSAVLISVLMYSGNGSITIASILPIAIVVAVIGILICNNIVKRLDYEDVL